MARDLGGPEKAAPEVRLHLNIDFAALAWTGTIELPVAALPADGRLDADGLEIASVRRGATPIAFEPAENGGAIVLRGGEGDDGPIVVAFSGKAETKTLFGLYRSRFGPSHLLTTHCEPTGARKIFPCVDRPDRKVRLQLTVRTDPDLEVVANAPVRSRGPVGNAAEWVFEPTPPMSTYLFFLAVGKFAALPPVGDRVRVRVLSAPGLEDSGRWASEFAPRVLAACEAYYGIPYPLPKLDLLAIPEHAFGAMENWGAISFQESRLLVNGSSSTYARRDVVTTIAHEVAHQWFGNLVTMVWWDDIWLNESFASLMETKITEAIAPELDPWTDFFLRTAGTADALGGDSLAATHPVRSRVEQPEEISQIFDEISYGKGASILAMLDGFLGPERFRAGVTRYLETFRYRNARTEDLWNALEQASGEPVASIAGPWTDRSGFPVVTARLGERGLELRQRRFSYLPGADAQPWPIPMVLDVDGRKERLRFDTRERLVAVPPGATVHLNPGAVGFYRVLYEGVLWDRLLRALPGRPARDRWSVLQDLVAFLASGSVTWPSLVACVQALRATDDRLVAETLCDELSSLAITFPDLPEVTRTVRDLLAYQTERVGLAPKPGERAEASILRDRVSSARVAVDRSFAAELSSRFAEWDRLDPNLRTAVAVARVRVGGTEGYREVRSALGRATVSVDALRLARALAWSEEPSLVEEALELAVSGGINRSHVLSVVLQAAANPRGRGVSWEWLKRRTPVLTEMFRGSGYLPQLYERVLPLAGLGREAEVREHFRTETSAEGARGLAKGLEWLEVREKLRGRLARSAAG